MERAGRAGRDAILGRVFPGLRCGHDPDIVRYFELRTSGRTAQALALFDRVLRVRYPDDNKRNTLFKLLQRSDAGFPAFHDELLWDLYDSVVRRLRETLDRICEPLSGIPPKDAYRALSALQAVVRLLPAGREAALGYLDDWVAFAELLAYRKAEVRRVRALAEDYFEQGAAGRSRVEFGKGDIDRIDIPASLERREDRALAFCLKYWKTAEDPAFERVVLLYSRKHGGPHHEVFRAIKEGRASGAPDEEILSRVSEALAPGYAYSTQGDLYMQRAWKVLKARLEAGPAPKTAPSPRDRPVRGMGKPAALEKAAAGKNSSRKAAARLSGVRKPAEGTPKASRKRAAPAGDAALPLKSAGSAVPRGSVSDRIKALSGRRYDVYREEFLARVGPAIRDWLSARRIKPKDVFEDPLGRAEDLVREFLEKNYANPYMDWEGSDLKARVEALGFSAPDLDGIIALWYGRRGK